MPVPELLPWSPTSAAGFATRSASDAPRLGADRDLDVVAGLQVADRDDMRDAGRPAEELGLGVGRERLVLALADQGLERGVVAALDRDLDGVGAGGEHVAAELVQPALAAAGCGCGDDSAGERRERDGADQTVLHGRFLLGDASGRT